MEYRKSAILHFITILVLLALSICVLVFATNENKKLYKTGNTVVGSILVALMGLAMIPVVKNVILWPRRECCNEGNVAKVLNKAHSTTTMNKFIYYYAVY